MNVKKQVDFWRSSAQDEFESAVLLVRNGKSATGMFLGNLALEKALKGVVCNVTGATPPYTHDLVRLAEAAKLDLTEDQKRLLRTVREFNIKGRYMSSTDRPVSPQEARELLNKVESMIQWLAQL